MEKEKLFPSTRVNTISGIDIGLVGLNIAEVISGSSENCQIISLWVGNRKK